MKNHGTQIAIPTLLKVEYGALAKTGQYLETLGYKKVVILFGNGLIDMFGETLMNSLREHEIEVLRYQEMDTVDIEDMVDLAFSFPNTTQAVLGIGGGKVIDAAKYCGFLMNLPFVSIPTSASSDGFSSASASLIVKGRRKSVPARMATAIIVDTQVIKTAPARFIYSGIGDMVSKITSLYDWLFEQEKGVAVVDDCAMMIAKKAVNSFVRTPFQDVSDDRFIRELMDSLAMSGIANEIAGSSAPTSGSEHLISHALDKFLEVPQLHGLQVGIATYLCALVQDHRYERINTVFETTGFWEYAKSVGMKKDDFKKAIDMAPSIKPFRHCYLHEEAYREKAKAFLDSDPILREILQ